jgi:hypothetical protein
MFDLNCNKCGEVYHADEQHIGKKFECKKCKNLITIFKPTVTTYQKPISDDSKRERNVLKPNPIERFLFKFRYHHGFRNKIIWLSAIVIVLAVVITGIVSNKWDNDELTGSNLHLENGTIIFSAFNDFGYGEIRVENGTNSDALIKLVKEKSLIQAVYIRKKNEVTLRNISPGVYEVLFCFGLSWDNGQKRFMRDCSYSKFEEGFIFEETDEGYDTYKITLHPVIGGTAKTETISRDEFERFE